MTDDVEVSDDAGAEPVDAKGDLVASYLVKVVLRSEFGFSSVPPTIAQLEGAIRTMVASSWQGLSVTAKAERTDR